MTTPTKDEEVALARKPKDWPQRPLLPLIQRDPNTGGLIFGFIVEKSGPKVYLGNMVDALIFFLQDRNLKAPEWKRYLNRQPHVLYADFASVYDDGWRID